MNLKKGGEDAGERRVYLCFTDGYMEVENTIDLKGKVVKWCDTWGVVNFYREGVYNESPRKAFIHVSKVVVGTPRPEMGSRVIFDLGPARSATELPQAFRVRVATSSDVL